MNGRVAELHVRYRVPGGTSLAATHVPLIDRVLQARLAQAVAKELESNVGLDRSVVVIREATARVTLRPSEWSLDHAMVERIGRASREAVTAVLNKASADTVIRFASSTEFVGSFVVDLMEGRAWERWYYGAFKRFRRADLRETLEEVLSDSATEVSQVFGWLAARGKLEAVLAVLGAGRARRLALDSRGEPQPASEANGLEPLAAAALALLQAAGVEIESLPSRAELLDSYVAHDRLMPDWSDRGSLTAWVWRFVAFVLSAHPEKCESMRSEQFDPAPLNRLLGGTLDWLDGEWLKVRLAGVRITPEEQPQSSPLGRHLSRLTPHHDGLLARLAALVRGGMAIDAAVSRRDETLVRMLAALAGEDPGLGHPDRALTTALERILDAGDALESSHIDPADLERNLTDSSSATSGPSEAVAAVEAVKQMGPSAVGLLREVLRKRQQTEAAGDPSKASGLYLLTRALFDLRLPALAALVGVPLEPLLGALAMKLLGVRPPFDQPATMWVGSDEPDWDSLSAGSLHRLQSLLLKALADQRHLEANLASHHEFEWRGHTFSALSDPKGTCWPVAAAIASVEAMTLTNIWAQATGTTPEAVAPERSPRVDLADLAPVEQLSPQVEVAITSVASSLVRAWSRWLPGVSGSSLPFLVRNCLARNGAVLVTDRSIDVSLSPAPLDIVLDMAGYFGPLAEVPWLGGRTIRFTVLRRSAW